MIIFLPFRGEKSKIMVDSDKPMCYNVTPPLKTVKKAKNKLKKLLTKQRRYGNINELLLRT